MFLQVVGERGFVFLYLAGGFPGGGIQVPES